jgi:hypothetical protein
VNVKESKVKIPVAPTGPGANAPAPGNAPANQTGGANNSKGSSK